MPNLWRHTSVLHIVVNGQHFLPYLCLPNGFDTFNALFCGRQFHKSVTFKSIVYLQKKRNIFTDLHMYFMPYWTVDSFFRWSSWSGFLLWTSWRLPCRSVLPYGSFQVHGRWQRKTFSSWWPVECHYAKHNFQFQIGIWFLCW